MREYSLALGGLLGCDLVHLLASRLQVVAPNDGAGLSGSLGVPEGDLPIQRGHGQLLTVWPIRHCQAWRTAAPQTQQQLEHN